MFKLHLTNNQKNNIFWYLFIPVLVGITLVISLSPWIFELLATPVDRVFSGINRWSTDYFIYLSYVELGIRGQLGAKLLITTVEQKPVFAHLVYTLPGFILGKFGLSSVFIYHFCRSFYGLFFLVAAVSFFYQLSKSKFITLTSFLLTFYVSGFIKIDSLSPLHFSRYLDWLQEQNIVSRATGPLHYNIGFVFFIISFLYYFKSKNTFITKVLLFSLFLNLTLLANPFAFLIIAISFSLYLIVIFFSKLKLISKPTFNFQVARLEGLDALIIIISFSLCLPLLFYYQQVLSDAIWGLIGMGPKYYTVTHPPIYFWETILSVGPIFFLGIMGAVGILLKKIKTHASLHEVIFLIIWLFVQFFLFFFGDWFKIHPLRVFSGLYYLPLAFFSAYSLIFIARFISKKLSTPYSLISTLYTLISLLFILFFLTFPNYYLSYKEVLFAFTDFKSFQYFSYPSKKQVEAFRFLEKNTPSSSGVLSMFEASSLIMGYSANSGELGMDHAVKASFYQNAMSDKQASQFLKNNRFKYVYFGYQEQSSGGNMDKLSYLKKIFENQEVKIYKVN